MKKKILESRISFRIYLSINRTVIPYIQVPYISTKRSAQTSNNRKSIVSYQNVNRKFLSILADDNEHLTEVSSPVLSESRLVIECQ